ncbi:TonB-dependent receptor [Hymenobacter aerilatus]|uniref:TonB-dependent receptor n=1 Tax=Hymenobacter aerilatus TaxID=2932251 RepID=A0A8T9SZQ7_9BACT|nr:TonB-dependent receptor [Hymenobacter aerilatus]UOR06424.1 TonB-dependent receptor [Hymenobacter aerilatus]
MATRFLSIPLLFGLSLPLTTWAQATSHAAARHVQQETGTLTGRIQLADEQAAESVSVLVKGTSLGTTTDAEGNFRLQAPAGWLTVAVTHVGYVTQLLTVQIKAGEAVTLPPLTLAKDQRQLSEVTVMGNRTINEKPVAAGKLPVRPLDLPQSIVTIDQRVLEQQQVLRVSDALANVSGVYVMGTTGGTQEELASRGFSMGSNNTFKNGVRYNNGALPEATALESFEVMKGSNAILYGNVAAGGIINLVTKKPRFQQGGQVGMRVGSYDFYKPFVDVYGAVNNSEHVAYRVNATYENARSFRQGVSSNRFYVNPSLLFKVGQKTDLLVEGDYLHDERTPDYGIGTINYRIVDVPRSRFLGPKWAYNNTDQTSLTTTLTHRLSDTWQVRLLGGYQGYDNDQRSTSRPIGVLENGDWSRSAQGSQTMQDYFLGELDVTGKFKTFFLGHAVLVGLDADKYNTTTPSYTAVAYDKINILDLDKYKQRADMPALSLASRNHTPIRRVGAYVQDLISVGEKVKVLAGVRYTYQETGTKSLAYKDYSITQSKRYDDAFSPRLGLVYQPIKTSSVFASYSNSFVLNTGIDRNGGALPPSTLNQFEVGVKNDLFNGALSANVTAYHIVNDGQAQTILQNSPSFNSDFPNAQELAGEVTSKGLEVDILSKPYQGWSLIGGYSYNHTSYTKSNIYEVGSLLRYNPNHTANLSLFYTLDHSILRGLQAGFTAYYVGERQAGRSTRQVGSNGQPINDTFKLIPLSSYTQFDASVGYAYQRLTLRLKLSNLLDKLSYNAHDDNSINPIAPRQLAATLTYQL